MFFRYFSGLLLITLVVLFLISRQWPSRETRLIFCDVGQGDAALIVQGSLQILIDGGLDSQVLSCLDDFVPFWDRTIEVMVASHPDLDHIGGLQAVLERYQVATVFYIPGKVDSQRAQLFQDSLKSKVELGLTRLILPTVGTQYHFSETISFEVINPIVPFSLEKGCFLAPTETHLWDTSACFDYESEDKNELSIALNLLLHSTHILFTGDMGISSELSLLEQGLLHDVDILKVGHHGSKSSTSKEFLEKVLPETSIISVGKNNRYNHPFPQVMQQLEAIGSTVLRTDTLGTLEFLVFEDRYTVNLPV